MAQRLDIGTGTVSGEAVSIAELVQGNASFSASENGVLIFRRGQGGRGQLTWFDRDGKPLGTVGEAEGIFTPRISPDQKTVAFWKREGRSSDIWLFDGERGNTTRFTSGPEITVNPVWSPDGSSVAYFARRSNENLIIERPASGIGKETVLGRSTSMGSWYGWNEKSR
jgi:dipeptidyl aminopeptidase/acylaminoacyl peptidase